MFAKRRIVPAISTIVLMIFLFSCSNESGPGNVMPVVDNAAGIHSDECYSSESDADPRIVPVHVYAITMEERIAARRAYSSIIDLDFPLSIQQVEMIEAGEIVEITDGHAVQLIISTAFGEELLTRVHSINQVGIISYDTIIMGDDWSCIKCCVAGIVQCCCKKEKDEGRWE